MDQIGDDLEFDPPSCLVLPIYLGGENPPRYSLRLLTMLDGTKTETYLNGSYRTYRAARKAAGFVEAAARIMQRRLRPPSLAGAEQAIWPAGAEYVAKVGLATPFTKSGPQTALVSDDGTVTPP